MDQTKDGTADEEAAKPQPAGARYDKDFLQKNIDRSIDFRKEYYKYALAIATALLAFTVSFPPNLTRVDCSILIYLAWAGLGIAIVAGVFAHYLWSQFFISWRDYDNRNNVDQGKRVRRILTWWRRLSDNVLIIALTLGIGCIVAFTALNLRNIAPKTSKADVGDIQIAAMKAPVCGVI